MAETSKVNKHLIEGWIKELRSGRFTQCRGKLTDNTSHCCLGVLCQTLGLNLSKGIASDGMYFYHYDGEAESSLLPVRFRDYIGLSEAQQRDLSTMNDNGLGFEAIADYLEVRYVLEKSTDEWVVKYKWGLELRGEQ